MHKKGLDFRSRHKGNQYGLYDPMMNMIICYDIADPRRLQKIAKIMEDFGVRVQKSIFEATLGKDAFNRMKWRAEAEMDLSEDGVKYFPLCTKCSQTLEIIGQGTFVDPDTEFYII